MTIENGILSRYLHEGLDVAELPKRITAVVNFLRRKKFDAIAFRGMSGALVAPAVAARLKKNLLMVRKPTDSNHSSMSVEGFDQAPQRYVIVDDFISTGETIHAIIEAVSQMRHGKEHDLIGIVSYAWIPRYKPERTAKEARINVPIWITGTRNRG